MISPERFSGVTKVGESGRYFLWEYAIDIGNRNQHKGTAALVETDVVDEPGCHEVNMVYRF